MFQTRRSDVPQTTYIYATTKYYNHLATSGIETLRKEECGTAQTVRRHVLENLPDPDIELQPCQESSAPAPPFGKPGGKPPGKKLRSRMWRPLLIPKRDLQPLNAFLREYPSFWEPNLRHRGDGLYSKLSADIQGVRQKVCLEYNQWGTYGVAVMQAFVSDDAKERHDRYTVLDVQNVI